MEKTKITIDFNDALHSFKECAYFLDYDKIRATFINLYKLPNEGLLETDVKNLYFTKCKFRRLVIAAAIKDRIENGQN